MHLRRLALRFFAAALLPLTAVHGMQFRVLSWNGTIRDLKLAQGREEIVLRAGDDALSPVYQTVAGEPLKLYREQPGAGPENRAVVATLPLPSAIEQAILVLAPASAEGRTYTGLWLDDSAAARPANTILLHNLSGRPVALKIGASQVLLPPKGEHLHPFKANERAVVIQAAVRQQETWERVLSHPQPVKAGFRILILIRDGRPRADGSVSPVDLVTFYDYRPPSSPDM